MDRRDFFRLLVGAPFALAAPIAQAASQGKTLILIELSGGNDGLNTLVPYRDPLYAKLRPKLAISSDQLLPITDKLALNPALSSLYPWWKKGDLAWVQGLGYPKPNRSHFSSLDIWETGSGSEQSLSQGWLSKVIPQLREARDVDGISLATDLGPLTGLGSSVLLTDINRFITQANHLTTPEATGVHNPALDHIRNVSNQARLAADTLAKRLRSSNTPLPNFPNNAFGKRLSVATQMMLAGVKTPVIKLSIGSFDTHNNQRDNHGRLLKNLADGIHVLAQTLVAHHLWRDTLIVTYSEFGRRVIENASQGTDHGTAAAHLVMGGAVQGGIIGATPTLTNLDNGDLRFTTDFRQLYASLTHHWWGINNDVLQTKGFSTLPLFKAV
jgi:uncharacterized protein (DUF1501 family)